MNSCEQLPLRWPPHGASVHAVDVLTHRLVALLYPGPCPLWGIVNGRQHVKGKKKKKYASGERQTGVGNKMRRMERRRYYCRKAKPAT